MKKLLVLLLALTAGLQLTGMEIPNAQQKNTNMNEPMVTIKSWDATRKDVVRAIDIFNTTDMRNPQFIEITRIIPKKYADLSRTLRDQQEEFQQNVGLVYDKDFATFEILITYLPLLYDISQKNNHADKASLQQTLLKKIILLTPEQLGSLANLADYLELNEFIEVALIAIKKQLFEYLPSGFHRFSFEQKHGHGSYILNKDQPNLKKQFFLSEHPETFDPYQLHPQLLKKLLPTLVDEALQYAIDNAQKQHLKSINTLAFTPDSKQLASGSTDSSIKIWNLENGQLHPNQTINLSHKWPGEDVTVITFSPDGKTLASGTKDLGGLHDVNIKIWQKNNLESWELQQIIDKNQDGHRDRVTTIVFSPDGKTFVSGSMDSSIKIWQKSNDQWIIRQTISQRPAHSSFILTVAFSPDGTIFASASDDKTIKIWQKNNLDSWELQQTLHGHTDRVQALSFSPDGKTIATGSMDNSIKIWQKSNDQWSLKETLLGHAGHIYGITFDLNGLTLASGSNDQTIKLWQIKEGKWHHFETITCYQPVRALKLSPDGTTLAAGLWNGAIKIFKMPYTDFKIQQNISFAQALLLAYAHKKVLSDRNHDGINVNLYPGQLNVSTLYDSFDQGELAGKGIKDLIKPLVYKKELTDKERAMPPAIISDYGGWGYGPSYWWDF